MQSIKNYRGTDMEIVVKRDICTDNSVTSKVSVNGNTIVFGLEPPIIERNGLKCIPFGRYEVHLRQDRATGHERGPERYRYGSVL